MHGGSVKVVLIRLSYQLLINNIWLHRHGPAGAWWAIPHLAGSLVGAHLEADGGLVEGFVRVRLWVIEMSSGAISSHSCLTRTLVCSHLNRRRNFFLLDTYMQKHTTNTQKCLNGRTCSPMTHWPALILSSSKCRACLSAYFTPMSNFVSIPLVFA